MPSLTIWVNDTILKTLDEMAAYNGVTRSDVCGAALSYASANHRILTNSEEVYAFDLESYHKEYGKSEWAKILEKSFIDGKAETQIRIIKGDHTINIPKGSMMRFVQPFIITLEFTSRMIIHFDAEQFMNVDIYDEEKDQVIPLPKPVNLRKKLIRIHL